MTLKIKLSNVKSILQYDYLATVVFNQFNFSDSY